MSFSGILDQLNKPKKQADNKNPSGDKDTAPYEGVGYEVIGSNWYSAKPYGFKWNARNGSSTVFFLPIAPSNLNITTHFATNIISGLYGTVEQHSPVRYYDIVIQGTTGITPKYVAEYADGDVGAAAEDPMVKSLGRSSFPIGGSVAFGGFFSKTIGAINQIINKATDLVSGQPKSETGVFTEQTGYMAFHNLYKFLLKYKNDAAGEDGSTDVRQQHPLTFFNYKDNNQYDCAIRSFDLTRSADNPMLYNYRIIMRAYNLQSVGSNIAASSDLNDRLKDLGLDGVNSSSLLGEIKDASKSAKSIIGSALGGVNVLGR